MGGFSGRVGVVWGDAGLGGVVRFSYTARAWWGGCGNWSLLWFSYTARPPPPVILPGAAFALLCLAGALRRASPFRLAQPPVLIEGLWRRPFAKLDMNGGARKNPRYGAESTSQVTIRTTATTTDWRARRGEACLVPALQSYRPDLQAEPFDAAPCRAFFRASV